MSTIITTTITITVMLKHVQRCFDFSKEVRQQTVRPCCLTCQCPCFFNLVAEQLVEIGDEVVGRAQLNDVANLLRQVY